MEKNLPFVGGIISLWTRIAPWVGFCKQEKIENN